MNTMLTCNHQSYLVFFNPLMETSMTWSKPEFSDLRFGFEITMYIANR